MMPWPLRSSILAIDLGGSGLRVALVGTNGEVRILSKTNLELSHDEMHPSYVMFTANLEQRIESSLVAAVASLQDKEKDAIEAVVCTSMREGFVILDGNEKVLYAGPNSDYRGLECADEIYKRIGDEVYRRSGQWIKPPSGAIHAPCRLASLEANGWAIRNAKDFLMLSDWITWLLCGRKAAEKSNASSSALFDLKKPEWCDDLIVKLGMNPSIFPPSIDPGSMAGVLENGRVGSKLGLRNDIGVFEGGADTQCSLIGCGAVQDWDVAIVSGTTTPIQMVTDQLIIDPMMRTWTSHHAVNGKWVVESNASKTGFSYRWFASILQEASGMNEDDTYQFIDNQASRAKPGSGGITFSLDPSIMGQPGNGPSVKGTLMGIQTSGSDKTELRDLCRGIMENLGAAYAENISQLQRVTGKASNKAYLCGGSTRSEVLMQVISDCTNMEIVAAAEPETTILGAGILAAIGSGFYTGIDEAVAAMVRPGRSFMPSESNKNISIEIRERWKAAKELSILASK